MTTAAATHLPVAYQVRTLLEELFGRQVDVRPSAPWAPLNGEPGTFALFVDDSYVVRAIGVCDIRFSAYAGAAIGLMPPATAQTAVKERALDTMSQENLYEVLNICAALYNVEGAAHMKLQQVHHVGTSVAPQVQALSAVLGRRLDLTVDISGYGTGRLSFVGVA
jgi:hypothetical protein